MIAYSTKLRNIIQGLEGAQREAAAQAATFCLSKDNIESVGFNTCRIVGMAGPIMQVLRAMDEQGAFTGDWTLVEAPVNRSNKIAVLIFSGDEQFVCDHIHKLIIVAQVQAA
jgi:hypothetical protein